MDIRELRINNLVSCRNAHYKVKGIYNDKIYLKSQVESGFDCIADVEELDPIPITEELLKELGFEEEKPQGEGWDYGIEKVLMKEFINDDGELDFISLAQYEGGLYQLQVVGTIAYVRDLHNLQNLVFLTTKKELI